MRIFIKAQSTKLVPLLASLSGLTLCSNDQVQSKSLLRQSDVPGAPSDVPAPKKDEVSKMFSKLLYSFINMFLYFFLFGDIYFTVFHISIVSY